MKKKITTDNRHSVCRLVKRFSIGRGLALAVAAISIVLMGNSTAFAWGPNRPTFTMQSPATYVTFDSITDNPGWHDERGFTVIKDVTDAGTDNNNGVIASGQDGRKFDETAAAVDGHTYMVKMFVHNNAAANYNLTAKNTRLMVSIPTASGDSTMIQGQIAADNCGANLSGATGSPCKFWDEAYLKGANGFSYKTTYVSGSGRYYNNVKDFKTSGFNLGDEIASPDGTGTKVGYDQMDGNLKGCFQYSGYATFLVKVKADSPSFTLTKQVRVLTDEMAANNDTKSGWGYNIQAKPGDTVQYRVNFINNGKIDLNGVIIRDYMDNQLSYIDGSTYVINSLNPRPGRNQADNSWIKKGLTIGNYGHNPASNGIVEYQAKIPAEDKLQCGSNTFDNVVLAFTKEAGTKLAQGVVTVNKNCVTPPTTVNKCKYNNKLEANDPKCVVPGVPSAGLKGKLAIVSLSLFISLSAVLTVVLMRKSHHSKKD